MLAELTAAWSAISAASKAVRGALETVHDVETKQAISGILDSLLDVQAKLSAAQAQYEALAEVKRQLEQKVMEYEQWDAEAARYDLREIVRGIFVYVLKDDHTAGEPVHWLCPNCFQERKKSILQKPRVDYLNHHCHRCQFDIVTKPQNFGTGDDFSATYQPEY